MKWGEKYKFLARESAWHKECQHRSHSPKNLSAWVGHCFVLFFLKSVKRIAFQNCLTLPCPRNCWSIGSSIQWLPSPHQPEALPLPLPTPPSKGAPKCWAAGLQRCSTAGGCCGWGAQSPFGPTKTLSNCSGLPLEVCHQQNFSQHLRKQTSSYAGCCRK